MMAFLLRWNVVPPDRAAWVVDHLISVLPQTGVEMTSYLPFETYRYGKAEDAHKLLVKLVSADLKRREYPEVSYAAIEAFAMGLMGIQPEAATRTITSISRLTPQTSWAELDHIPIWSNEVKIRHDGRRQSTLTNLSGRAVNWEARFYAQKANLKVNGMAQIGKNGKDEGGRPTVAAKVQVNAGEKCTVAIDN
jgi:hypothetical protein